MKNDLRIIEYRLQNPEYRNSLNFIIQNMSWTTIQDSLFDLPAHALWHIHV